MYFLGNVSALEAPSIPLLCLIDFLYASIPLQLLHLDGTGTRSVTCGMPCTLKDAVSAYLNDSRDARRGDKKGVITSRTIVAMHRDIA